MNISNDVPPTIMSAVDAAVPSSSHSGETVRPGAQTRYVRKGINPPRLCRAALIGIRMNECQLHEIGRAHV